MARAFLARLSAKEKCHSVNILSWRLAAAEQSRRRDEENRVQVQQEAIGRRPGGKWFFESLNAVL